MASTIHNFESKGCSTSLVTESAWKRHLCAAILLLTLMAFPSLAESDTKNEPEQSVNKSGKHVDSAILDFVSDYDMDLTIPCDAAVILFYVASAHQNDPFAYDIYTFIDKMPISLAMTRTIMGLVTITK